MEERDEISAAAPAGTVIDWQVLGDYKGLVEFVPVNVTPVGYWPEQDALIEHVGTAAAMSRLADTSDPVRNCNRVLHCIRMGHHSVLEHINLSAIIDCDRGTTHALVRHRHCAFTQSSTVYGKFSDKIEIVSLPKEDPVTFTDIQPITEAEMDDFAEISKRYLRLKSEGLWGERTRDHLPISLRSRLFMTANLREWFYIVARRSDPATSVRIHCVAVIMGNILQAKYPVIWEAMNKYYVMHPL